MQQPTEIDLTPAQVAQFVAGSIPACSPYGRLIMAMAFAIDELAKAAKNEQLEGNVFDFLRGQVAIPDHEEYPCPVHGNNDGVGTNGVCPYS